MIPHTHYILKLFYGEARLNYYGAQENERVLMLPPEPFRFLHLIQ
jgi:hypothetical protein